MNKHYISLNSQFIVVLDGIVCFSLRFCDNLLFSVKYAFSAPFFCKQKCTRVFK